VNAIKIYTIDQYMFNMLIKNYKPHILGIFIV